MLPSPVATWQPATCCKVHTPHLPTPILFPIPFPFCLKHPPLPGLASWLWGPGKIRWHCYPAQAGAASLGSGGQAEIQA